MPVLQSLLQNSFSLGMTLMVTSWKTSWDFMNKDEQFETIVNMAHWQSDKLQKLPQYLTWHAAFIL